MYWFNDRFKAISMRKQRCFSKYFEAIHFWIDSIPNAMNHHRHWCNEEYFHFLFRSHFDRVHLIYMFLWIIVNTNDLFAFFHKNFCPIRQLRNSWNFDYGCITANIWGVCAFFGWRKHSNPSAICIELSHNQHKSHMNMSIWNDNL